jgi:thiol:disulfide interchange protein DsbD
MPANKIHYSKILKRKTEDLGYWNLDFQATKYGSNAQPLYVLAGHDLVPLVETQGANFDTKAYATYLKSGLTAFKNK